MKEYKNESYAADICRNRNRACKAAKNFRDIAVVVDGPDGGYCVVDIRFAQELDAPYKIYL